VRGEAIRTVKNTSAHTIYLALKTGSSLGDGCVFRVYLSSIPSAERPGTFRSLKHSKRENYFKCIDKLK
jgi:hypothetical protein